MDDYSELSRADLQLIETSKNIGESTSAIVTAGMVASLAAFPTFGPIKIAMSSKMINNLKYIKIFWPTIIQNLFDIKPPKIPILLINYANPDNLFIPKIGDASQTFDNRFSDDLFEKYEIELYYINNFGDKSLQFLIVFFIAHLVRFLNTKQIPKKFLKKIIDILYPILVWGWLITFYTSNIPNIIIYLTRSWYFSKYNTGTGKLDLAISIIMFLICFLTFFYLLYVQLKIYDEKKAIEKNKNEHENEKILTKNKNDIEKSLESKTNVVIVKTLPDTNNKNISDQIKSPNSNENHNENVKMITKKKEIDEVENVPPKNDEDGDPNGFKRFKVLYIEADDRSLMKFSLIFFELLKFITYSLIVVIFYEQAILQVSLLLFTTIYYIIYLFVYMPLKNNIRFVLTIIPEFVLLYIYTLAGYLAYLDVIHSSDIDLKNQIGRIFSYGNWTLLIACILLVGFLTIEKILKKIKKYKEKKKKNEKKEKKEKIEKKLNLEEKNEKVA